MLWKQSVRTTNRNHLRCKLSGPTTNSFLGTSITSPGTPWYLHEKHMLHWGHLLMRFLVSDCQKWKKSPLKHQHSIVLQRELHYNKNEVPKFDTSPSSVPVFFRCSSSSFSSSAVMVITQKLLSLAGRHDKMTSQVCFSHLLIPKIFWQMMWLTVLDPQLLATYTTYTDNK